MALQLIVKTRAPKGTKLVNRSRRAGRRRSGYGSPEEDFGEAISNVPEYSPGVLYLHDLAGIREGRRLGRQVEVESEIGVRRSEVGGRRITHFEERRVITSNRD